MVRTRAVRGKLAAVSRVALVAALLPVVGDAQPAAGATHPCAVATDRCDGTIDVPLNWDAPGSERITAGFAWVPRRDRSVPAAGTVYVHPGGFGADTGGVPMLEDLLGPVLEHTNLLVVDVRGTGTSSPLRCDGLDPRQPETIRACAEQLGPRAAYFTTDQAVRDLDAVRSALGVPALTLHGSSYGTVFAQAYAARFPSRTAAVFLDSPDPMDPDGYATNLLVENFGAGLGDLDAVCEPSRSCRAQPGSANDRLAALVRLLRLRPDPAVPLAALAQLVHKKAADAVLGREITAAITAYLDGDGAPLRRLAAPILPVVLEPGVPINPADTAGLPYSCGDVRYPFDRDAPGHVRQRQLDSHYARHRPVRPFTVDEVYGFIGGSYPAWCVHWPSLRTSPPLPPDARYPDVPALVIGGQLGGGMGADAARAVAARFPHGMAVEVPFGGHTDAFAGHGVHNVCLRELMRRFVADPRRQASDPGCTAQTYRALGTFPRTLAATPAAEPATTADAISPADRRIIAAVFATVEDGLSRRAPEAALTGRPANQAGLRGGQLTLEPAAPSVRFTGYRFVDDVAVFGTAAIDGGQASADVVGEVGVRTVRIQLTWTRRSAVDSVAVSVRLDGRPVNVLIPVP